MQPLTLVFLFGGLLGAWTLRRVREAFDHAGDSVARTISGHVPSVNQYFFRQLFHYGIHRALSFVLRLIERIDRGIRRVVRINRKRAVSLTIPRADSHLDQIRVHKEEVALTDKEKEVRKEIALRGDSPLK
jgi:hypothetical protein